MSAAATPSQASETATANTTIITATERNIIPKATTEAAARLPVPAPTRCSTHPSVWLAAQRTAPSAQPWTRQPAARNTGSASAMTTAAAATGSVRCGSGRGWSKVRGMRLDRVPVSQHRYRHPHWNSDHRPDCEAYRPVADGPPDERTGRDARAGEAQQDRSGAREAERRAPRLHCSQHTGDRDSGNPLVKRSRSDVCDANPPRPRERRLRPRGVGGPALEVVVLRRRGRLGRTRA